MARPRACGWFAGVLVPLGDGRLEPRDQRLGTDRLGDEIDRPGSHGGNGDVEGTVRAGRDQGHPPPGELGQPVGAAKRLDVGDHHRAARRPVKRKRLVGGGASMDCESAKRTLGDEPGERAALAGICIDDKDVYWLCGVAAECHMPVDPHLPDLSYAVTVGRMRQHGKQRVRAVPDRS